MVRTPRRSFPLSISPHGASQNKYENVAGLPIERNESLHNWVKRAWTDSQKEEERSTFRSTSPHALLFNQPNVN